MAGGTIAILTLVIPLASVLLDRADGLADRPPTPTLTTTAHLERAEAADRPAGR